MRIAALSTLPLALCAALTGCGGSGSGPAATAAAPSARGQDAHNVAVAIADTLQACSYDGKPVTFGMGGDAPGNCKDMIAQVMNFTGLPQNFVVTEAGVPNAAAAILLDQSKIPHRVIAFNPQFMEVVLKATGGNPWAAVSIMAHEAGHHLAGHTIQPGGSQPPVELEADKFSGFVLYKMGASRGDALAAINTLVPAQLPAGASHPARSQRVSAVTEGWDQACAQTGRSDCGSGTPGSTPPPGIVGRIAQSPARPAGGVVPGTIASPPAGNTPVFDRGSSEPTMPAVVVMPKADATALPTKGTQFIYDEVGLMDPATRAEWERRLYEHARTTGVEIVTIIAKDLDGMTPDAYAWAMMRQLRVGKLDVGNGAVIVHVPGTRQLGAALGPGVKSELRFYLGNMQSSMEMFYQFNYANCVQAGRCNASDSKSLMTFADEAMRQTKDLEWTVRYQTLQAAFDVKERESDQARAAGDVASGPDTVRQRIIRTTGTIVLLDPPANHAFPRFNPSITSDYGRAAYLRTDDGYHVALYFDPEVERLAPGGRLQQGQRYAFITREIDLDAGKDETQKLNMLSYVSL